MLTKLLQVGDFTFEEPSCIGVHNSVEWKQIKNYLGLIPIQRVVNTKYRLEKDGDQQGKKHAEFKNKLNFPE